MKTPAKKNIETTKVKHALGRFRDRDFKFQFRRDIGTKGATADGNNNF